MNRLVAASLMLLLLTLGCTQPSAPVGPSASATIVATQTGVTDPNANTSTPTPVVSPPPKLLLSEPTLLIKNTSVFFSWKTDIRSDAFLEWGLDATYGNAETHRDNSTEHRINISGLEQLETYHYRIISCAGEVCNKSRDYNFTTPHKECVPGSTYISAADVCIDNYEASISLDKKALSQSGKPVSVQVSRAEAETACRNVGKRLCTSLEFTAACNINGSKYGDIGDVECNVVDTYLTKTGVAINCTSNNGVHDMIGNAWELVSDTVTVKTPFSEGLVDREDILYAGNFFVLTKQPTEITTRYGNDYYLNYLLNQANFNGTGIARGGAYGMHTRAGCFAFLVGLPPTGVANVGFRCCI